MDYELLQRHGATDIGYKTEPIGPEVWHSAIDDVFHPTPTNIFTIRFELDGAGLDRLERALKLLEEHDVIAVDGQGPYGTSCWDAACDEDIDCVKACDDKGGWDVEEPADGEWDEEGPADGEVVGWPDEVNKAPTPAHYKYILRYR